MPDVRVAAVLTAEDKTGEAYQSADRNMKNYAASMEKTGQATEELTRHHLSMRHAMGMLASQTGMGTAALMHFYYATQMVPGAWGIALGAVMLLKHGLTELAEAEEKAREEHEKFAETIHKYSTFILKYNQTDQFGTQNRLSGGAAGEAAEQLKEINKAKEELQNQKGTTDFGLWKMISPAVLAPVLAAIEIHNKSKNIAIDKETAALDEQYQALAKIYAESVRLNDMESERKQMEADISESLLDQRMNYIPPADAYGGQAQQKEALRLKIEAAQDEAAATEALYRKYNREGLGDTPAADEARIKATEARAKLHELGVQSDNAQKAAEREHKWTMRENEDPRDVIDPYDHKAKLEADLADNKKTINIKADKEIEANKLKTWLSEGDIIAENAAVNARRQVQLDQAVADNKKALNEEMVRHEAFILSQSASLASSLGDTKQAALDQEKAAYLQAIEAHAGNADELEAIREAHEAKVDRIKDQENMRHNEFSEGASAEMWRLRGHKYEAELDQLQTWFEKEQDAHRAHFDELLTIEDEYRAKLADIYRREVDEKRKTMDDYIGDTLTATRGEGVGGVYKQIAGSMEKINELKREGRDDEAMQGEGALAAQLAREEVVTERGLRKSQGVSFQDTGSAWQAFASSVNKGPEEREKRQFEIDKLQVLRQMERLLAAGVIGGMLP